MANIEETTTATGDKKPPKKVPDNLGVVGYLKINSVGFINMGILLAILMVAPDVRDEASYASSYARDASDYASDASDYASETNLNVLLLLLD